jgi:hypothetical protein
MDDLTIWDILGAVSHTKNMNILEHPDFERNCNTFIINKALSYFEDSVLAANMMNERPDLPKRLQALFLINTLRPRRRFSKWMKAEGVSDDVKYVAEYYQCSQRHAKGLVSLHTPEQMTIIRARLEKGGAGSVRNATK